VGWDGCARGLRVLRVILVQGSGGLWRRAVEGCGGGLWRAVVEGCGGLWRAVRACAPLAAPSTLMPGSGVLHVGS